MPKPRALVLTGYGINCDEETAYCFERAGGKPERVHMNLLFRGDKKLEDYQIFAFPGGFLHGDDIAAGKVLATKIGHDERFMDQVREFVSDEKPIIGICNGFQVLVKSGLLPGYNGNEQIVTLTYNDSNRFEDRWVYLGVNSDKCIWTQGIDSLYLPVRHKEGKFIPQNEETLRELNSRNLVVARYVGPDGERDSGYPHNPNGSVDDVAALCDPTGTILGIMPHPEAYFDKHQHPRWTREDLPEQGQGMQVFRNGVEYASEL